MQHELSTAFYVDCGFYALLIRHAINPSPLSSNQSTKLSYFMLGAMKTIVSYWRDEGFVWRRLLEYLAVNISRFTWLVAMQLWGYRDPVVLTFGDRRTDKQREGAITRESAKTQAGNVFCASWPWPLTAWPHNKRVFRTQTHAGSCLCHVLWSYSCIGFLRYRVKKTDRQTNQQKHNRRWNTLITWLPSAWEMIIVVITVGPWNIKLL